MSLAQDAKQPTHAVLTVEAFRVLVARVGEIPTRLGHPIMAVLDTVALTVIDTRPDTEAPVEDELP